MIRPVLLFPAILLSFQAACAGMQTAEFSKCTDIPVSHAVDSVYAGKDKNKKLIIITQNLQEKNPGNELLHQGGVYEFEKGKLSKLQIKNRDEFPFHPAALDIRRSDKKTILYILNRPVSYQYAVEVFELKNDALLYLKRMRVPKDLILKDLLSESGGSVYLAAEKINVFRNEGILVRLNEKNWRSEKTEKGVFQLEKLSGQEIAAFNGRTAYIYNKESLSLAEKKPLKSSVSISVHEDALYLFRLRRGYAELFNVTENKILYRQKKSKNTPVLIKNASDDFILYSGSRKEIQVCR